MLSPSELARLTGVSTDTLRHYERKGVLGIPPRSQGGYRQPVLSERDRGGARVGTSARWLPSGSPNWKAA